ncbi:phosphotransferase [Paenibacillus lycopersici]|uniref:Phosphotransferase n=1 Tax=Paenibacillus lycopersici TaxID=2704462 RepID=A0A6C0FYL6_9BACL|nr:phosphotransferase [Paenibacillus lycopersici]QHT61172.1 phosphotransferase [Paenibacillus lycopersici]
MNIPARDAFNYEAFPSEVREYFCEADVAIIKNKPRSSVFHIISAAHDYFLKVTPKSHMHSEAIMTSFLNKYGSCPRVIQYIANDTNDFLITERLDGSDAASDEYLEEPERLAEVFGESLFKLHHVNAEDCPIANGLEEMVIRAERNYSQGRAEMGLLRYIGYANIELAYKVQAYGKHLIDEDRLRLCGLLSAFNGFRGQDYYEVYDHPLNKNRQYEGGMNPDER